MLINFKTKADLNSLQRLLHLQNFGLIPCRFTVKYVG